MSSYINFVNQNRRERETGFASDPLSWLNLVGLFWLDEGENSFGNSAEAKISLPKFPLPISGHFLFQNGQTMVHPKTSMTMNGGVIESRPLNTDKDPTADLLEVGTLTMKIIIRGDSTLVRVWDREAELKRDSTASSIFPPTPSTRSPQNLSVTSHPNQPFGLKALERRFNPFLLGRHNSL